MEELVLLHLFCHQLVVVLNGSSQHFKASKVFRASKVFKEPKVLQELKAFKAFRVFKELREFKAFRVFREPQVLRAPKESKELLVLKVFKVFKVPVLIDLHLHILQQLTKLLLVVLMIMEILLHIHQVILTYI